MEEYDRAPTLWLNDNNSRPYRLSGGAVYELPFGAGKPMLKEGGVWAALAGGWQTGGTFEYQPGSLLAFNNICSSTATSRTSRRTTPRLR